MHELLRNRQDHTNRYQSGTSSTVHKMI
jgi:hypothetical protein